MSMVPVVGGTAVLGPIRGISRGGWVARRSGVGSGRSLTARVVSSGPGHWGDGRDAAELDEGKDGEIGEDAE